MSELCERWRAALKPLFPCEIDDLSVEVYEYTEYGALAMKWRSVATSGDMFVSVPIEEPNAEALEAVRASLARLGLAPRVGRWDRG